MDWLLQQLAEIESAAKERLEFMDSWNGEAAIIPGLTLRIDGEPIPWPVDLERDRVLLSLIAKVRGLVEQYGNPEQWPANSVTVVKRLGAEIEALLPDDDGKHYRRWMP